MPVTVGVQAKVRICEAPAPRLLRLRRVSDVRREGIAQTHGEGFGLCAQVLYRCADGLRVIDHHGDGAVTEATATS